MKNRKQLEISEYLKKAPSELVFRHLVKKNLTERRIISSEFIASLKRRFITEESQSRFRAMNSETKMICALAYLFGSSGLDATGLDAYREKLLSSFLIYSAYNKHGKDYYFGFRDIEESINSEIAAFFYECLMVDFEAEPVGFLPMRCLNDFMLILIQALKGFLQKKQDGDLGHASVTGLKKLLHSSTESCLFDTKEQDTYSVIRLLLAYGVYNGYLIEDEKSYKTTFEQIDRWMSHSYQEMYDDFINFLNNSCGMWSPKVVNVLLERTGVSWLSTSFLPYYSRNNVFRLLHILHYIGLIDAVLKDNEILWRRISGGMGFIDNENKRKVLILPDFSAIIPQEVSPDILYEFSFLGTFLDFDKVYKSIISRDAVNESLSRDISGERLVSYLSKWKAPENVIITVREWIREFSRLSIVSTDIIVSSEKKTSIQILSYPPMKDILKPIKAHTLFSIKKGHEKEVRDLLLNMGFDPRVPEKEKPSYISTEALLKKERYEELALSFDFKKSSRSDPHPVKTGKYSEELKELDMCDMFHVIEYAILMKYHIKLEYEGDTNLHKGNYNVIPSKLVDNTDSFIEGKTERGGEDKKFYIKKIKRIGVLSL